MFLTAKEVEESLERRETATCLAWCHDNKSRLRKMKVLRAPWGGSRDSLQEEVVPMPPTWAQCTLTVGLWCLVLFEGRVLVGEFKAIVLLKGRTRSCDCGRLGRRKTGYGAPLRMWHGNGCCACIQWLWAPVLTHTHGNQPREHHLQAAAWQL